MVGGILGKTLTPYKIIEVAATQDCSKIRKREKQRQRMSSQVLLK
jgi:hypothetical protein